MNFDHVQILILVAGKGTRMKSKTPKVLHKLHGKPMIHYLLETVAQVYPKNINMVVGHERKKIMNSIRNWKMIANLNVDFKFIMQEEQLGTGHAVLCAEKFIKKNDDVFVLLGDVPLIKKESLIQTFKTLHSDNAAAVVLTTELSEAYGYGRIIRDERGQIHSIKEENEVDILEKEIKEVNTGIMCFRGEFLWSNLHQLKLNNRAGELYLTDIVSLLRKNNHNVVALKIKDYRQFIGINSPKQLEEAKQKLYSA